MILRLLFIRISLILLLSSKFLFSIPADVEDISNRKYFPAVLKAIQESQTSIKASLYYISYFKSKKGKVHDLLNALFDASKRGVKIEVVLDRGREFVGSGNMSKKNIRAFSYLKQNGIKVFYDDIDTLNHSKYLIIDEKVVVGSSNWSENAFTRNLEATVLIKSSEVAKDYLKLFNAILKFSPERIKDAIPIPREFIRNKNMAPSMIMDSRSMLDLYLLLQYFSYKQQSDKIILTKSDLMKYFFYDSSMNFKGRGVLSIFKSTVLKEYKKFSFIESYEHVWNKHFIVYLKKINKAESDSLYLSELYWTDEWYERLPQKAKISLLYILDKTDSGRMGRSFEERMKDAVKLYGIEHTIFSYGTKSLQRYNLIDKYIYAGKDSTTPNTYVLNDFYIYSDFEKKLEKIRVKTDIDIFEASMKIANMTHELHDLKCIKEILELGKKYGIQVLNDTIQVIDPKKGNSLYRRFDYVIGMIKAEGEGKNEMSLLEFEKFKEKKKLEK